MSLHMWKEIFSLLWAPQTRFLQPLSQKSQHTTNWMDTFKVLLCVWVNCAFNDFSSSVYLIITIRKGRTDGKFSLFFTLVRSWTTEATWPTGSIRSTRACSRNSKASWRKALQASIGSFHTKLEWFSCEFTQFHSPAPTRVSPPGFQVVPAVKGRQAVRPSHERERLCDQAEIWQPLLLQGVHTGRVMNHAVNIKQVKSSGTAQSNSLTMLNSSVRLKRTTDVMFGGKQVVVCGYGEVSRKINVSSATVHMWLYICIYIYIYIYI